MKLRPVAVAALLICGCAAAHPLPPQYELVIVVYPTSGEIEILFSELWAGGNEVNSEAVAIVGQCLGVPLAQLRLGKWGVVRDLRQEWINCSIFGSDRRAIDIAVDTVRLDRSLSCPTGYCQVDSSELGINVDSEPGVRLAAMYVAGSDVDR